MHTDTKNSHVSDDEDEEIDPLDAFMAGIDDQVAKEKLTEGQVKDYKLCHVFFFLFYKCK